MTSMNKAIERAAKAVEEVELAEVLTGHHGMRLHYAMAQEAMHAFADPEDEEMVEQVARVLYEQEKERATLANAVIGKTGLCIEPFEECADSSWRPDARAVLEALNAMAKTKGES